MYCILLLLLLITVFISYVYIMLHDAFNKIKVPEIELSTQPSFQTLKGIAAQH
jgi:hypothetical protein